MKKLLIVGNGPIFTDYSRLLNESDVIVRFNNANKIGNYDDGRQTILALSNTGGPGKFFFNHEYLGSSNDFKKCEIILVPRVEKCHAEHFNVVRNSFPWYNEAELKCYHEKIIPYLIEQNKKTIVIDENFNYKCFNELKHVFSKPFICPSTGFMVVKFLLDYSDYSDYEVHLIGFGFRGWKGHPWAAEKKITQKYAAENRLILHEEPILKVLTLMTFQKIKKNKTIILVMFTLIIINFF
jgi:hypothetical protein